ncbi:hypothetical protein [Afifella sp. YEN Y35]|uniref:hypothetical protein n=1 Tax=Afifella sp. YEN Y35 TaxID=3388337 RepID=UPI0039E18AED
MVGFEAAVAIVKDFVQIIFWCVAGVLAVLSYRQARKSIFQPAKNEVFKIQIKEIQDIMKKLDWKSSIEDWEKSGLRDSSDMSLYNIFKLYVRDRFYLE